MLENGDLSLDLVGAIREARDFREVLAKRKASAPVEVKTPAPKPLDVAALIKPLLSVAPVELVAADPLLDEPPEVVTGIEPELDRSAPWMHPLPDGPAKAPAPVVIKPAPKKNKRSMIGAVTRPDPATFAKIAAEALARAETPKERAHRRRATKEAQKVAA